MISSAVSSHVSGASTFYTAYSSSISTALSADASKVSTFVTANSQSIHNDLTSMSSSIAAFASTFTPPPDPFAKRDTVTVHKSVISDDIHTWRSDVDKFAATWVPPTTTWSIPDAVYTWTPPDVIFDKRAVSVVSHGLTCHGQAVVTMSASNAASLVASATSAASGTQYYADGSTRGPATATSTSSSTAGAAINTRGPMLAVGGAAIAFAFAAL